jgi:hypothetical protein
MDENPICRSLEEGRNVGRKKVQYHSKNSDFSRTKKVVWARRRVL